MATWIKAGIAPDINTPVLVTFDNGTERIAQSVAILDEGGDWRWWQYEDENFKANPKVPDGIEVIAWQPLPTPYKGDNDADRADVVESITSFAYMTLGSLTPTGESKHDERVQEHIDTLGEVVLEFVSRLIGISKTHATNYNASPRACGYRAHSTIDDLIALLDEEDCL